MPKAPDWGSLRVAFTNLAQMWWLAGARASASCAQPARHRAVDLVLVPLPGLTMACPHSPYPTPCWLGQALDPGVWREGQNLVLTYQLQGKRQCRVYRIACPPTPTESSPALC